MSQAIELVYEITDAQTGMRLDQALAHQYPDYSRSRLKAWILSGFVLVDQQICKKPREKVVAGQSIHIHAVIEDEVHQSAEAIDLNIVYEDQDILVINKPAGLVVHPGAGHPTGTLLECAATSCSFD